MAKRIDTVTITIDAEEAKRQIDVLKQRSKELGKEIAEMKKQLEDPGLTKTSAQWKQLNKDYRDAKKNQKELNKLIDEGELAVKGIDDVLSNLSKATYNELIKQQRTLAKAIKNARPNTEDYVKLQGALQNVNKRVEELKDGWKGHESQIIATAKRLTSYVMVYGGFNFVVGKIKEVASANMELSDSLADIQKTTGIAGDSLRTLSKEIDRIDTRSTQDELHQLAATAGQMGISSSTEVLGFVKAANQLKVALNELGEDGVQSLSKIALLTGDADLMGIEKSLLAIGSSINELSANSAASAGPIADFMRRVGGLAPVANLATSDLAALGATADALGQPIEVAGTALNKFIMSLVTNSEDIEYALNIEHGMIKGLIDSGRTMEAIVLTLEKVQASGKAGGDMLSGIFKELGSDGARMTQVLSAMSQNTTFLREQVEVSTNAFYEATSATDEYNVKNENAAAIWERIGNTIREVFVNADYTSGITKILKWLLNLVESFTSLSNAGIVFRSVLLSMGVALVSTGMGINKFVVSLFTADRGVRTLSVSWYKFTKLLKANWFTLLASAITLVWHAVANWNKEQRMLTAHLKELNAELDKEHRALDKVKDRLEEVKDDTEKRAELVRDINRTYGTYLDAQLSEAAGYKEIAKALELVNEQLDLKYAKMIYERKMEKAIETYADDTEKESGNLIDGLSKIAGIGDRASAVYKDVLVAIRALAKDATGPIGAMDSMSDVMDKIRLQVDDLAHTTGLDTQYIVDEIRAIYNAEVALNKAKEIALAEQNANIEAEAQSVQQAKDNLLKEQKAQMEALMSMPVTDMTEEEIKAHYERILQYGSILTAEARKRYNAEKVRLDSQKDELMAKGDYENLLAQAMAPVKELEAQLEPIRKAYEGDAWGKALNLPGLKEAYGNLQNLGTASVDNLVNIYKQLEDAGKKYTDVNFFNSIFNKEDSVKTIDDMHAFFKDYAKQVKARLKELGYTTAGNFDWSSEEGKRKAGGMRRETKEEYQAALAALEAYYAEEATVIRRNGMEQNQTETEIQQRLLASEEQHLRDRQELRKRMLGEDNIFDPSLYIGKVSGTDFFAGKDLDLLTKQIAVWGQAMTDGIRRGIADDMLAVEEQAWEVKQKVLEIVQDRAWHEQVDREMLAAFESIDAFWGAETERTEENGKLILDEMKRTAQYIYKEDAATYKQRLENNAVFGAMFKSLNEEQQKAFIILLGDYHDKVIDADKRFADERKRIYQQAWKDSGYQETYDAEMEKIGSANATLDWFEGSNAIAQQKTYFDAKAELINAEVALEAAAHAQRVAIMEKTGATQQMRMEEERAFAETMQNLSQQMLENYKARFEHMADISSTYGEIIGDGFVRMAFDEENAGKEMIKSLLRTTVEMASQFAQRLIMQQTFSTAMQGIKAQQSAQEISAAYTAAMTEIGIEASKMAAIEAIAAGEITAQSMATPDSIMSYGASGAARAALLIGLVAAATAGALALIDNLFPGAASEASAEATSTPKRRITTGMLTYAEGKYPVLGNDGVVYDAKYAGSGMKTGVYSGAHVGIFSEKKPEAVIDGDTTHRLIVDYPWLWNGILTLSKYGHMGFRTFASGNVEEVAGVQSVAMASQAQMERMEQTMAATQAVLSMLTAELKGGLKVNYFGKGGIREAEQRGGKWAAKNRV